jgi:hypothetical protein
LLGSVGVLYDRPEQSDQITCTNRVIHARVNQALTRQY